MFCRLKAAPRRLFSTGNRSPQVNVRSQLVWTLAITTVTIGLGARAFIESNPNKKTKPVESESIASKTQNMVIGDINLGGSFKLVDQNGNERSNEDLKGKYMLIYFGFANCPDFVIIIP